MLILNLLHHLECFHGSISHRLCFICAADVKELHDLLFMFHNLFLTVDTQGVDGINGHTLHPIEFDVLGLEHF